MEYRILLVEDDKDIREIILLAAKKRNYKVTESRNGLEAKESIESGDIPDLIVLDINMPGMDGFKFCRWLREDYPLIPVIFLSARCEEYDKIIALEIGGDDYLTKPFSINELFARIAVSLRRVELHKTGGHKSSYVKLGDIEMNDVTWECNYKSSSIVLTVSEFRILYKMITSPGVVFSRESLTKTAYPEDYYNAGRSIDIHISRIRKKLQKVEPKFNCVETVFQVGYKWKG